MDKLKPSTHLPSHYQGMKDYVRYASKEIDTCHKKIERLKDDIVVLKKRIEEIDEQKGIIHEIE